MLPPDFLLHLALGCRGFTPMSCIIPPHPNCSIFSFVLANRGSGRESVRWQEREKGGKGGGRKRRERERIGSSLSLLQAAVFYCDCNCFPPPWRSNSHSCCSHHVPGSIHYPYRFAPLGGQVVKVPRIYWCQDAPPSLAGAFTPTPTTLHVCQ